MCPGVRGSRVDPRWRSGRSPATPDRLCLRDSTPLCPTLQHNYRRSSHHARPEFGSGHVFPATERVPRWVAAVVAGARRAAGRRANDAPARRIAVRWPPPVASVRCPEPRLLALPALLFALVLAACGGGGGAAGAEPASAVPAGTAIYFEGVVRPEGDQREDVLDAARKVLRTDDPERKLRELIDKGLADSDADQDDVRGRHRAVAGREGRRVGRRRRPEEAGLRRDRRGQGHRGGAGGDRQGRQVRRRQGQGALLLRRRLPGGRRRRGGRDRRRLLHGRHRGRVQAHGQGAGRRLARRVQEVQGARSTGSTTTGSGSSTSTSSRSSSSR